MYSFPSFPFASVRLYTLSFFSLLFSFSHRSKTNSRHIITHATVAYTPCFPRRFWRFSRSSVVWIDFSHLFTQTSTTEPHLSQTAKSSFRIIDKHLYHYRFCILCMLDNSLSHNHRKNKKEMKSTLSMCRNSVIIISVAQEGSPEAESKSFFSTMSTRMTPKKGTGAPSILCSVFSNCFHSV